MAVSHAGIPYWNKSFSIDISYLRMITNMILVHPKFYCFKRDDYWIRASGHLEKAEK